MADNSLDTQSFWYAIGEVSERFQTRLTVAHSGDSATAEVALYVESIDPSNSLAPYRTEIFLSP